MSHPNDGDRFTTPQPQEGAWNDQPHSQPEAPQYEVPQHEAPQHESSPYERSPYEAPQASAPGQQDSSAVPGQSFPAAPQASPAPQGGGSGAGAQKSGEANFFKAMVDFKFDHFITVKFSTFLYILAFVVAVLLWLGQILLGILFGVAIGAADSFYGEPSFNPVLLILAILFGWIPSVIALVAMRLGLEFSVATVRTAQNTKRIAEVAEHGR
ncbi:MAG TPA: DUF4282 domain-containing protein [Actinomycetaceae bacterium]|nr:DUF4282 domain-containing protein [Actinomycetaceae bacterium]